MELKSIKRFLFLLSLFCFVLNYNPNEINLLGEGEPIHVGKTEELTKIPFNFNSPVTANVPDAYKFQKYQLTLSNGNHTNYIKLKQYQ